MRWRGVRIKRGVKEGRGGREVYHHNTTGGELKEIGGERDYGVDEVQSTKAWT